ncbi:MAG: biotin--[acetyl-CoA-carboxylase] ligase [Paracoccaceae bacterium]
MSSNWRIDAEEGLWPEGVGRRILPEIDSTNAEAARIAASLTEPCWILALNQTAAHGRRGRAWINPPGNFAATYVMHPAESPDKIALRSFVAALALHDALVAATGHLDGLALKWPNDVLLQGGKVAGILLETSGQGASVDYLAIGIGVNLANAPDPADLEPGATRPVALDDIIGGTISPQNFLNLLAPAYAWWEHRFTQDGFAPIRETWLRYAARIGKVITARTGTEEITGTFETIDDAGNLILTTPKGRRTIAAAEVFF